MAATLTRTVVAGGQVFPQGTPRTGRAAEVITGPWWTARGESAERDTAAEFDPSAHSIPEVLAHLGLSDGRTPATVEEFSRVRAAEADGKARKTLLDQLDAVDLASYGAGDSGESAVQD